MKGCCDVQAPTVSEEKRVLYIVLSINIIMFMVQITSGIIAHSTALLADSVDMFSDALAYGISIYAVGRGAHWLAKAAIFKGGLIMALSIGVLTEAGYKLATNDIIPHFGIMAIFSMVGLAANGTCFYLLTRHRTSNINMNSAWVCARNDILANLSVLLSAGLVAWTGARWPDITIGVLLAGVFAYSAVRIIKDAIPQLKAAASTSDQGP